MKPQAQEQGTFWVWEASDGLPPLCQARIETSFSETGRINIGELAAVMGAAGSGDVKARLAGRRQCFTLKVGGQIACYGWVTTGAEFVSELEREFHLLDEEAYIWDCVTLQEWRRQGLYSARLSQILARQHAEGSPRIWIGASRANRPSVKGILNTSFQHVLDLGYRRFYRLTLLWIRHSPSVPPHLLPAAHRILLKDNERRWGPLAVGFK